MSFQSILQKYRSDSYSERDKGARFEELISRYLMTDPAYSSTLEKVWVWSSFPSRSDFGGRDTGIDLVARTKDGEYWAVQCKCYAEDHPVTKADMDTFLSTSGRMFRDIDGKEVSFSLRVIVATTDNWSFNAVEVTKGQTIPVTIIGLSILENAPVDWDEIEAGVHGKDARQKVHELREHQREALEAALNHYKDHDRGKMIMACGTGKTFSSSTRERWLLMLFAPEMMASRRILPLIIAFYSLSAHGRTRGVVLVLIRQSRRPPTRSPGPHAGRWRVRLRPVRGG